MPRYTLHQNPSDIMKKKAALITLTSLSFLGSTHGIILFDVGNSATILPPTEVDLPWDAVARITNGSNTRGSAVHIGGGYMLTADHLNLKSQVTFDGSTFIDRDTGYSPKQVAPDVDLKVFRLLNTPSTSAVTLNSDGSEVGVGGYHIGWGRGRASDNDLGATVQEKGDQSTTDKRWGTNTAFGVGTRSWSLGGTTYTQQAITNYLNDDAGETEAGLTRWDSGSPFFQEINGSIVLSGIGGAVEEQTEGSATFGEDPSPNPFASSGDRNFLVQISAYEQDILAIVPEPSYFGLGISFIVAASAVGMRRRVSSRNGNV